MMALKSMLTPGAHIPVNHKDEILNTVTLIYRCSKNDSSSTSVNLLSTWVIYVITAFTPKDVTIDYTAKLKPRLPPHCALSIP